MSVLLHVLLLLCAIPLAGVCGYLAVLTLLSFRVRRPPPSTRTLRFDVLVPAHDEAPVIARTVDSLRKLDWPQDRYRIIVIADNCTDDTALIARAAGAGAIERNDGERRGKGYALEYGFSYCAQGAADAIVVIDADTVVSANLLETCAARIERGARAMQANYGVLNPDDSWRTRLITIAYGAFHAVRSRSREHLRVSCGLRGNGVCFTQELLREHPFRVYSMAEDLEYGVLLGLAGVRVHYIDEASADAELVSSERSARSQRQRWEGGRFAVARGYLGKLLAHACRQRSGMALELALDLATPPIGYIGAAAVGFAILAGIATLIGPGFAPWLGLAAAYVLVLAVHVFRGWQLSPLGWRALLDLAYAPFFIAWKLVTLARRRGRKDWIRTDRE